MAMLFITHDLGIVRKIASDVAVMQQGRIVEAGKTADVFANPQHEYTKMLLAAEPKGAPPAADASAEADRRPPTTCASGSRSSNGFLRRTVGHVKAVDGVSLTVREGADRRRRRRIRLGQDDARPGDPAPHPLEGDRSSIAGAASTGSPSSRCGRCAARCRSSFRTRSARCRRACRSPRSSRRG